MAQLKDTIISGSMRVTDTLYSTTNQLTNLNIPTSSNAVTFGPGTNEQIIKSNGTSVYWTSADSSINDNSTSTNIPTSAAVATFVENKGYASNSIIAPVLSDATADKSYNIDDMFIYDNKLYQATSAISANGVISPNSNCVMVDLVNNISKKLNYANTTEAGVVKINGYGLQINNNGVIQTSYASDTLIKAGTDNFSPIVAGNLHKAVFYGLAKAANDTTQSQSNNAIGQYTNTAKLKIQTMLGVNSLIAPIETSTTASTTYPLHSLFYYNSKLYKVTEPIVENNTIIPNTNCVETNIAANLLTPVSYATSSTGGVVKVAASTYGVQMSSGTLCIATASAAEIKIGTNTFHPITPSNQNTATFYGLAKAAGDTTQSASDNAVGAYTDTAKLKIHNMLGINNLLAPILSSATASMSHAIDSLFYYNSKLYKTTVAIAQNDTITPNTNCVETTLVDNIVKDTDYATSSVGGVIKVSSGLQISSGGLRTYQATTANIKGGTTTYRPIVPNTQHIATFYGLAKAAGDTTQSTSDNTVGTYTDEARAAIINMLGIDKLIGNYLADTYADKTYEIGDLFTMDGKLYKVTAKINQNGVITPNTNCVLTSIIEGLINADLEEY